MSIEEQPTKDPRRVGVLLDRMTSAFIRFFPATRLLLVLFAIAACLFATGTFAPQLLFPTTGHIFVSAPQLYGRDRLINDRSDEDAWYRTNLAALDKSTDLVAGTVQTSARASLGLASSAQQQSEGAPLNASSAAPLPFEAAFEFKSGMRDALRQLMLENLLDDPNNALVGVKFDTTIIPGENTHGRAYVRISGSIPNYYESLPPDGITLDYVAGLLRAETTPQIQETYRGWLHDVAGRMSDYINQKKASRTAASPAKCDDAYQATLVQDAFYSIFGEPIHVTILPVENDPSPVMRQATVYLPAPWGQYFVLSVSIGGDCDLGPIASIDELQTGILIQRGQQPVTPLALGDNIVHVNRTGKYDVNLRVSSWHLENRGDYDATAMFTTAGDGDIDRILQYSRVHRTCADEDHDGISIQGCKSVIEEFEYPAGLINFVGLTHQATANVIGVIPKSRTEAYLADRTSGIAVGAAGQSASALGGFLSYGKSFQGVDSEAVLTGYADGEPNGESALTFGWTMGPVTQAAQESELALLSIPPWVSSLSLSVTVGWLDRSGNDGPADRTYQVNLAVPPDYEALDAEMARSTTRMGPYILDDLMNAAFVRACLPADVAIPGYRLWRSAIVTLGDQPATRVTVMPDMRGLLVHFDSIANPTSSTKTAEMPLRIWTSEGQATATHLVTVVGSPSDCATS